MQYMTLKKWRSIATLAFMLVAIAFVALSIIGAMRFYTPVQRWDMWTAYLGFYINVANGDWAAWFAQHNEHQLFFDKLFFWLDIKYFGGEALLLLVLNFLLTGFLCLMLFMAAKNLLAETIARDNLIKLAALLMMVCFSLLQVVTFIWGFALQNYLALVLPLLAFFSLNHANHRSVFWFWLAVLLGICSVGTMANGLLVLPLLGVLALLQRQSAWKIVLLWSVTVAVLIAYLYSYDSAQNQGTFTNTFLVDPLYCVKFFLTYLGAPFYGIFENYAIATVAGVVFLLATLVCMIWWFKRTVTQPIFLVLLIFLIFIIATGVGITVGRAVYALNSAVESRYMINLLLGWATLGILLACRYRDSVNFDTTLTILCICIPLALLPAQVKAYNHRAEIFRHQQFLAALALSLQVDDKDAIANTYPYVAIVKSIAAQAVQKNLSIFADPLFENLASYIGQQNTLLTQPCSGAIEKLVKLDKQQNVYRLSGWALMSNAKQSPPQRIFLLDQTGKIVGVALTGGPRDDLRQKFGEKASLAGFDGYVWGSAINRGELKYVCESGR